LNTIWLAEHLVASTQPVPQPKSTPLLEALKAEKSANKDKEAILRNHAHYSQIIPPVSRKEDKKKNIPAPQPQASKATEGTSVTDSGSVPKSTADGPVTEAIKPVKAPRARAPRPPKNQSNNPSQNSTVDDAAAAPSEAPARRSRPVIGLASRQFEAALSGVGGRDRRSKRERGKEKEPPAPAGNDDGPSSESAPASSSAAVPVPPRHGASATGSDEVEPRSSGSPKKERTRRGGGRGGGGGAPPVKISGILQRTDTAPAPAPSAAIEQDEGLVNTTVNFTASVVGGGNRGRRGRGRGRGGNT
jgi:regulator of nonsense transcripts 3